MGKAVPIDFILLLATVSEWYIMMDNWRWRFEMGYTNPNWHAEKATFLPRGGRSELLLMLYTIFVFAFKIDLKAASIF